MEDIRWTIDRMYPTQEKKDEDIRAIEEGIKKFEEYAKNPKEHIKDSLDAMTKYVRICDNFSTYAFMKQDEDSRVTESQKQYKQASQLWEKLVSAMSYMDPFFVGLSKEDQEALLKDEDLKDYRLYLERLFRYSDHTLSDKEEYLLSRLSFTGEAPQEIYYYLSNTDLKFPKLDSLDGKELTAENFTTIEQDERVEVRKEAFEKLYGTIKGFGNTIASAYYNNCRALSTVADLKGYDSARHMELFKDDVDVKVYDSLLESIHKNMDLMHRYYAKKKEVLGLKEQHMYDVYLPMVSSSSKTYTFEEAKQLCIESVRPLGEDYVEIYKKAFTEGWVDVYPREGKRGGAYSSGSYDSTPYISMNFNGTLDSVFTLAHEMGHSMHSYFSRHNNDFLYSNYVIFVAEVASTFNENLLLHYLKEHAETEEEKQELLDFHLNSFKSTVYRQAMFAEFEKIVHERIEKGDGLTQEDMNQIYLDLNKEYFGDAMVSDDLIAYEWMRIPHFYNDFYVYKYSTGFCAATVLSQGVLHGGEEELKNYRKFLCDGGKHFPIEQLKMAGCDMSNPKTVDKALDVFRSLVEELEEL